MRIMHALNIKYTIGDRTLLNMDQFSIHSGDRIGMIGKNGEGKSLLLEYLLGQTDDEPTVEWYGSVGYFKQLNTDIDDKEWHHLSGGEITMSKLDEIFQQNNDLLLLDEPTNNLDWQHIEELEKRLNNFKGAVLIVSHDRTLLDQVCSRIWELENGKITSYKGNFSDFEQAKLRKVEQQYAEHDKYVKEKKRLIERMRQKEQQAQGMRKPPARMSSSEWQLHKNKAAGKQKKVERVSKVIEDRIERLEKVDKPFEWDDIKMDYTLATPIHKKQVLTAKKIQKSVNGHLLFQADSLKLRTGSKTALIGANGSGKTTLIKQLLTLGDNIELTKQANIGLFEQELAHLPEDKTILQYVQENSPLPQHVVRIILGRLRFFEEDVHKRIGVLSGGERVKTALARLLTGDYNVLVLDEPTNHLDLEAISALEKLIQDYPGTVLFVSHDRRFVNETADHLWILENHTITSFNGNLTAWQTSLEQPREVDEETYDLMALENKLTEIISRLSLPDQKDDVQKLEHEYQDTLNKIQKLRKQ
ncbi:ribosomal protection-like ABC-F family protein [Pontibacillus marinus]|uniref:ABC transporter domain-containing protein n=1 Tax=Pontibacillus marinus BH030004 = DSM 16465 TaxID=1385511 RepID=A0A0A5FXM5_9BACI|nr:ABC-F type ribosomal protection protein [Pontibacillus marinus]KGX83583.1 hypothetical protein N783_02120 [Pontibacillus marinus BH030004 = DSM 16465]